MSTQPIYRVLLNLPPIDPEAAQGGQLILEESTTDPGYQKGDTFQVTKRVGKNTKEGLLDQQFPFKTGWENQEFSFMVTVLERQVHYDGDQKFFEIITESSDRTEIQAYVKALQAQNS